MTTLKTFYSCNVWLNVKAVPENIRIFLINIFDFEFEKVFMKNLKKQIRFKVQKKNISNKTESDQVCQKGKLIVSL